MTPDPISLQDQIAAGATAPLYMLVGDDDAEKAAMAAEFLTMVEEGLEAFNVDRLHGAEAKVDQLVEAASLLPMMAPRRIVLVLGAEHLLVPKRETAATEQDQARLEAFLRNPPDHATVVFVCGPLDNRRRLVKLLRQQAVVVDCGSITTPAEAARWVRMRAKRDGVVIEPDAVQALAERAGMELSRLRAGFERVTLYAGAGATVTVADVREAVTAAPDVQEHFGVANAIRRNDVREALRELKLTLDAGAVPFMVLGQLRLAAERVPAPRLRGAIEAVFRTDLALKSSGGDPRGLLERLVVELCAAPRGGHADRGDHRRPG